MEQIGEENTPTRNMKIGPGWLYCFRTSSFTALKNPIYKVGRTSRRNPYDRLDEFSGANRVAKLLHCGYYPDLSVETYVLRALRDSEKHISYLPELGREFFSCVNDQTITSTVKLLVSEWDMECNEKDNIYITEKDNESVASIAKKFGISTEAIIEANVDTFSKPIRKKDRFYEGTTLQLPIIQ